MEQLPCPRFWCIISLPIPTSLIPGVWLKWVSPWLWRQQSASYWLPWPMTVWLLSTIPCIIQWFMNGPVCVCLAATSWGTSLVLTAMLILSLRLHFCGANVINHFVCEILSLIKLACSDTSFNELMILITSVFTLLLPFGFVLLSYVRIAMAVIKIHLAQGRLKAFTTCGSHLTVVTIFYGAAISMYMKPQSNSSPDQVKFISVFYGALTPMLNPLIYSLRNKDVKGAIRKVMLKRT